MVKKKQVEKRKQAESFCLNRNNDSTIAANYLCGAYCSAL